MGAVEAPEKTAIELKVEGMTCASCVARVERSLKEIPGVEGVTVNLITERAYARIDPQLVDLSLLEKAVAEAGYEAHPVEEGTKDDLEAKEEANWRRDLLVGALFTLPLLGVAMGPLRGEVWDWVQLVLALPVLYAGRRFYRGALGEIRKRNLGMNTLVSLGSGAAYAYSLLALFVPSLFPEGTRHLYFEAGAVILTLILTGKYMESRAKRRTREALEKLVALTPKMAHLVKGQETVDVPAESLIPGDHVWVRPGEAIPADGTIVQGESHVDESLFTGESLPQRKASGATVWGGTVNQEGALLIQVEKVGRETVLAQMVRFVEEAQSHKPRVQEVADRIAAVFVPIVLTVAALTFILWMVYGPDPRLSFAFVAAVSVMVIACPCAMGLATPAAIAVATGRAAQMGLLFRDGQALETLARADTFAFDKTGTLTEGKPQVTDIRPAPGSGEEEILALAAGAESFSEHPLARAILQKAREAKVQVPMLSDFRSHQGRGIEGRLKGKRVLVGSARFLQEEGISLQALAGEETSLMTQGKTLVYVALEEEALGLLAVADPVKKEAFDLVHRLRNSGKRVVLLTGDRWVTARSVAHDLGIEEVRAEVLPHEKAEEVQRLQQEGRTVVFVGDGVNDAPALAQAHVGMAMGTGTDIAAEAGDVVLLSGKLESIPLALELSRKTLGTIYGNFFWAYAYNILLIPVAAGVLYPFVGLLLNPMYAAFAMSISSLFVLGNSLRLRGVPLAS
ncbi:MAG: heavy metal translocating P-type ATPase [Clostridiales bacterium]|nr:heavy metal translocating P-type ATPase [Clostridiales bacterium]